MDMGIAPEKIVRLGSKSTVRTAPLLLYNQPQIHARMPKTRWLLINAETEKYKTMAGRVGPVFTDYSEPNATLKEILVHIEFHEHDRHYFHAFRIPEVEAGHIQVGRTGKQVRNVDFLQDWLQGRPAGPLTDHLADTEIDEIWRMDPRSRKEKMAQWQREIRAARIEMVADSIDRLNNLHRKIQDLWKEKTEHILQSKRLICCTTTAASMHAQEIQAAAPGIIIVEEAGEILESHILAAMGPSTQQLVLIGDHKQLRPKVKNFKLTVESGRGFDLNRSLFERLILQGRKYCTLLKQHRMRPEISELIRHNYPDLEDAEETKNRASLRGFQDNVIFVNHDQPEAMHNILVDKLDENAASSKQNGFEAEMVLKVVRYLGQQGYRIDDLVVLTPYLVCTICSP
jgi:hypothetical protein